jgi:hypothetical protein
MRKGCHTISKQRNGPNSRRINWRSHCWWSLQQKFDRQNLRFVRSIWNVSCTYLILIKLHELRCDFHRQVHILGEIGNNIPHVLGTAEPPGTAGPAGGVGLVGAACPATWRVPSPKHRLSLEHNLDKRDSLRKHRFDQMVETRITWIHVSNYPVTQPPQSSSRGDPRRPWA